ncbi:MAG: transporter substrate-binding domain-containing protein [Alphaproteobacteria bacterium]|nr:transporter substrate-binding domain-containing protein [Alphaproteobacteria bacterium]
MKKNSFKLHLLYLIAMILIIASPNNAFSAGCLSDTDKIRVTGHAFFPPIGWHIRKQVKDSIGRFKTVNEMHGFGKDFLTEFFEELDHPRFKYVYKGTISEALYAAEKGEVDVIFGIPHTSDPLLGVHPIFPSIISSPIVAIVPIDEELKITSKDDLIGIAGIASKTDLFGETFPKYIRKHLTVYKAKNMDEAFSKLLDGKYTYMMASYYYAHAEAIRLGVRKKIKFIPINMQNINLFMAISKRSPCIKDIDKFSELLKKKYSVQSKYDEGIRKIIREAMFEWEQYNDTYRFDPEYQTIKNIDTDYGTSKDREKEYKEKWKKLKEQNTK